ncbi:hypothetical protein ABZP36_012390 [Zizania latifolia]
MGIPKCLVLCCREENQNVERSQIRRKSQINNSSASLIHGGLSFSPASVQAPNHRGKRAGWAVRVLLLTEENVEMVLDQVRPSLIGDGGNVALPEINGLAVVLKL